MALVLHSPRYQKSNGQVVKRQPYKKQAITKFSPRRKNIRFQVDTGLGPERKNTDVSSTMVPALTSSFCTPQLINGLAQGVGNNERVGRKAIMKSVALRYIYNTGSAGGQQSQVRIVIFYDKQTNGAAPLVGDVIAGGNFTGHNLLANSDRFVILMDEISDSAQSSQLNITGKRYMKVNLEVLFGGATSGISSINSGSLMIMAANNSDPTVGSSAGTVYFTTRVKYTDA